MVSLQLVTSNPAHFLVKTTTTDTRSFQFFLNHQKHKHVIKKSLSCRAAKDQEDGDYKARSNSSSFKNVEAGKFDRRDILLGLGGLYGTTAASQAALADPIVATNCGAATKLPECANIKEFCPRAYNAEEITDYTPPNSSQFFYRPAAHQVDDEYIKKYETGLAYMRSLPKEHPHSLAAQAAIHCAYCDGSYEMDGFPDIKIQVHNNWLFFPFHRWYLHFYEKIVAKYSGDPNFRIPYWNWDDAEGAVLPAMFANRDSPLYDKLRNEKHMKLKVDLNYMRPKIEFDESFVGDKLIESSNNHVMYTQMVCNSKLPSLFFGNPYRAGDIYDKIRKPGAIENQPHTQLHVWTGDPGQKLGEDMGRFYSAGRDPVFYAHHANVDRMWNIWKTLPGNNRRDLTDPDWLDASFLFYDEDEKLVRVKVRGCLATEALGYDYRDVEPSWKYYKPDGLKSKSKGGSKMADVANAAEMPKRTPQVFPKASQVFPKVVDGLIKVTVPRPKKSRSIEEKEAEEEVLEIEGIEYDGNEYVGFNVFLNGENEIESGPNNAEFAGTYSNVPFKESDKLKVSLTLGISELLDTLGADDDDNVVVAIVPRIGKGKFSIDGVRIYLSSE